MINQRHHGPRIRRRGIGQRLLGVCLAVVVCGAHAAFTPPTELTVVTDVNYPPYLFFNEDGRPQGILPDKWALWSQRTGVPVRVKGMEWAAAQRSVQDGGNDVLEAVSFTAVRAGLYEFSPPYAPIAAQVFFHRSISGINDIASMRGFAIGAKDGSACGSFLAARGIDTIRKYPSSESLVKAAGAGEVRLFCMDTPVASYFLFKQGLAEEFRETPPLYSTQFHWVVRKGQTELREFIQQGFTRIKPEEIDEIDARWLGSPLHFPLSGRYLTYAGAIAATVLGLALVLIAWNRGLQRRVAARTSDLRAAMESLQAAKEKTQDLYDRAPCGYHSLDMNGVIVEINDTELQWLGRAREEVVGKCKFPDFMTAESCRLFADNFAQLKARGEIRDLQYDLVRKDGSIFSTLLSATMARDRDGSNLMSRSTLHDITERKCGEALLRARLCLSELGRAGDMEKLLQAALDLVEEITRSQIGFFHFVDPEQEPLALQAWSKNTRLSTRTAASARQHYPIGGTRVWMDCIHQRAPVIHSDYADPAHRQGLPEGHAPVTREAVVPIIRAGKVTGIMGVGNKATDYVRADVEALEMIAGMVQDSMERIRAEETLRRTEDLYRLLFDTSIDAILLTSPDGDILAANPAACRMFQRTEEQIRRVGRGGLVDASDPRLAAAMDERGRTGRFVGELSFVREDGSKFPGDISSVVFNDKGGQVRTTMIVRDITERKLADALLRETQARFSAVFHASPIGISVSRVADGKVSEVNDAALRLHGYTRDEVIGRTVHELGVYANPAQFEDMAQRLREHGSVDRLPIDFRSKSGAAGVLELSSRIVELQGEQCRIVMMVDITERKRLEEIHLQAQKLESLGTLAGGIAHDFNNILAAIRGNADLAAKDVGPDHMAAECLVEISKASARAGELVRRIMAFGRPKDARQEAVDLGAVVGEVLSLLRSTLPAGIALSTDFADETPHVLADVGQIHEAIVNLTTNAAYAIGRRTGSIEYRLEPVQVEEQLARSIPGIQAGSHVRLTVSDSGCGMDTTTLERIFDAFYTTKPVGEGTGLGLSMVHGTMKSHGGAVTVESAPGKGSSFALYFPAATQKTGKEVQGAAPSLPNIGRRVLYVDDEEALVFLASRVLSRLGHQISSFTDPEEALEAFRAHPQDFDIVVTDLSMPYLSGLDLARAVLALRPGMPVLMTTGYIRAEDEDTARAAGIRELVLKPVTMDELGHKLDQLIRDTRSED